MFFARARVREEFGIGGVGALGAVATLKKTLWGVWEPGEREGCFHV